MTHRHWTFVVRNNIVTRLTHYVPTRLAVGLALGAAVTTAGSVPVTPLLAQAKPTGARSTVDSRDTLTSSFVVDGLKVILRRNAANNVIAANLTWGGRNGTARPAGLVRQPSLPFSAAFSSP